MKSILAAVVHAGRPCQEKAWQSKMFSSSNAENSVCQPNAPSAQLLLHSEVAVVSNLLSVYSNTVF